jgi:glutamate/aspartate transport system permease protein
VVQGCFGKGGDITYLDWMLSAWGWTVSVSLLALLLALVIGSLIGTLRTLPNSPMVVRWAMRGWSCFATFRCWCRFSVVPRGAHLFPAMKGVPGFVLVVFALGFFTSARIAEQVRSGIQALPRGQRYAGMAMGFTTFQTYRYVLLPDGVSHHHSAADQRDDEHLQELVGGVCRVGGRAHHVRHAGAGRNLARHRGVPGGDGLYIVSAFAINRIMAFIEKRVARPRLIVAGGSGGVTDMNLDFSFYNWDLISNFVLKGLYFSLMLTVVATIGGVLSWHGAGADAPVGQEVAGCARHHLRQRHAQHSAGHGDSVVLPAGARHHRPAHWCRVSAVITFIAFEAAYFSEIMRAGIQSIPRGQVYAGQALGMTYGQNMKLVVLPQAFRNMLPVLLTQTIILFQDTSLVYAIGAYDMLKGFEVAGKNFGRPIEAYLAAAVLYFVMCYALSWAVKRLHQKIAIIR